LNTGFQKKTTSERTPLPANRDHIDDFFTKLDDQEIPIVRVIAAYSRHNSLRIIVNCINFLGNGWIFGLIAVALLLYQGGDAFKVIGAAFISAGLAHAFYPVIKVYLTRFRPIEKDPSLCYMLPPLDRYSFPSGHCMTAIAVMLPMAYAYPELSTIFACIWGMIAIARLASAHHYPTDLLVGTLLGWTVGWPITLVLLA
jgi:undecaprenyl-diphosphatase